VDLDGNTLNEWSSSTPRLRLAIRMRVELIDANRPPVAIKGLCT